MQDVVGHPALVITRNVEWGTVIFGFEQANKYTIYDQEGNVVALLAEELGSFGKEVGRQLLRTRRPFTATVFSPDGNAPPKLCLSTPMLHWHGQHLATCYIADGAIDTLHLQLTTAFCTPCAVPCQLSLGQVIITTTFGASPSK